MDEAEKINAFLNASGKRMVHQIADVFMRKLIKVLHGSGGRVSVTRAVTLDETTMEFVVTDTIETRVFGPPQHKRHFDA